jgi:hypothetical protein
MTGTRSIRPKKSKAKDNKHKTNPQKRGMGQSPPKKPLRNRIDFGEYLILRPTLFG